MDPLNFKEEGSLNEGKIRSGVIYEGKFFEFGSLEYNNLMLMEGKKEENEDTLLGIFSEASTKNVDDILNNN